ncbi:MAG TPA: phosphatase PAP2 family protein [Stellaceae bacterium]|nr:phosphatase PAP2 family protein [Stellaceae bacterium]
MKGVAVYAGVTLAVVALFLLAPQLDLWISGLFYEPQHGFFLNQWGPVADIAATVPWLVRAVLALAAGAALWLALAGRPLWRLDRKALVFLVAALALGPGIVTNTILKDHWGRARPVQIEAFGGAGQFTPAPLPANQCAHNCSFVSGHAAVGFVLVGFALLMPAGRRRVLAQAAALAFGAVVGFSRIAAGAHFLSDIVYAGLIVYGITWLLHRWIVVQDRLGAPAAVRLYRRGGGVAFAGWRNADRLYRAETGRLALWTAALAIAEGLLIGWFDEPLALALHAGDADIRPFFDAIARLGLTLPYFVLFGLAYVFLRWGAALPRLRPFAAAMRRTAAVPAFLFATVAASGLAVDLLKVIFGRARPKLLFASGDYGFDWLGLQSDHWSFPSGHAATAAALMTALWCLWPRHVLFYIACAALIAASRVITGAHYPSDVLMGAFIGIVTTRALWSLYVDGRLRAALSRLRRRPLPLEPASQPSGEEGLARGSG